MTSNYISQFTKKMHNVYMLIFSDNYSGHKIQMQTEL